MELYLWLVGGLSTLVLARSLWPSKAIEANAPVKLSNDSPAVASVPAVPVSIPQWTQRLALGLSKTRHQIVRSLDDLFASNVDKQNKQAVSERIFDILIGADVGVNATEELLRKMKDKLSADEFSDATKVKGFLKSQMLEILNIPTLQHTSKPRIVMMVGVNGVGKTTTTGKLAHVFASAGAKVAIGAADTFRAAAVDQLKIWAERSGSMFVTLMPGSDPASVAFEAVKQAKANGCDVCLIDTAGRLHNRNDLMAELGKVRRVMGKEVEGAPHDVYLVIDATTGQNGLAQAKAFGEIVPLTGLVLTKLDGTAKGGVALSICYALKLPIVYLGVGEAVEDLQAFDANQFVDALFG